LLFKEGVEAARGTGAAAGDAGDRFLGIQSADVVNSLIVALSCSSSSTIAKRLSVVIFKLTGIDTSQLADSNPVSPVAASPVP
jgi:hypothetical protein